MHKQSPLDKLRTRANRYLAERRMHDADGPVEQLLDEITRLDIAAAEAAVRAGDAAIADGITAEQLHSLALEALAWRE